MWSSLPCSHGYDYYTGKVTLQIFSTPAIFLRKSAISKHCHACCVYLFSHLSGRAGRANHCNLHISRWATSITRNTNPHALLLVQSNPIQTPSIPTTNDQTTPRRRVYSHDSLRSPFLPTSQRSCQQTEASWNRSLRQQRTNGRTDERTNGRTDERTNGRTDERTVAAKHTAHLGFALIV